MASTNIGFCYRYWKLIPELIILMCGFLYSSESDPTEKAIAHIFPQYDYTPSKGSLTNDCLWCITLVDQLHTCVWRVLKNTEEKIYYLAY